MAAFAPSTNKVVTVSSSNLSDASRVDARDMIARLFIDMGIRAIEAGNTAPADRDVLWYHNDIKALKRYDAVQGNWFPLTPDQHAMHLIRRAVLGAVTAINVEAGDLFVFWDASLGEVKVIGRDDLLDALGALRRVDTDEGLTGGGPLDEDLTLTLDVPGLAAKNAPAGSDLLAVYSVADSGHRKSTVEEIAESIVLSDYIHSELFFLGSM